MKEYKENNLSRLKGVLRECTYLIISIMSISLTLVLCGEVIIRGSTKELLGYIYGNTLALALTCIMVAGFIMILYGIVNHLGIAVLVTSIIYIGGQICNYFKFKIKGEYVTPSDLNLLAETKNIMGEFTFQITSHMLWAILCTLWLICATYLCYKFKSNYKLRIGIGAIGLVLFGSLTFIALDTEKIQAMGLSYSKIDIQSNYERNGFLLSYLNRIEELNMKEPNNYTEESIEELLSKESAPIKKVTQKPNIIMIMSEAFIDPLELEDVSYSEDPLPYFHSLTDEFSSGNIVTSVFGGYTAQTEYEVLTGHSTDFTGPENIAYTTYINNEFPSMVSVLGEEDYQKVAIHPYDRNFYSRDKVYQRLGFDKFIAEDNFEEVDHIRSYITDQVAYERIIEEYENRDDSKPFFAHIVTMQNHGPYGAMGPINGIEVESSLLKSEDKDVLETYVNLIKESDKALENLIEYFSNQEEPTLIVLYGDHAPVLGDNNSVYKELGIMNDSFSIENSYKIQHTPFLIWDNYNLTQQDYENIDASYLGAIVLEKVGIYDAYFNYLYHQIPYYHAYNRNFYIDHTGTIRLPREMEPEVIRKLEEIWLLQYDRIFGKRYSED